MKGAVYILVALSACAALGNAGYSVMTHGEVVINGKRISKTIRDSGTGSKHVGVFISASRTKDNKIKSSVQTIGDDPGAATKSVTKTGTGSDSGVEYVTDKTGSGMLVDVATSTPKTTTSSSLWEKDVTKRATSTEFNENDLRLKMNYMDDDVATKTTMTSSDSGKNDGIKTTVTPDNEIKTTTTSEKEIKTITTSENDIKITTTSDKEIKPTTTAVNEIKTTTTKKETETTVTPEKEIVTRKTPVEEIKTTATPVEEIETTATPEKEVETTVTPEKEIETTVTPEKEIETTVTPEKEIETTVTPEKEIETTVTPEKEIETTVTPEKEIGTKKAPIEEIETTVTPAEKKGITVTTEPSTDTTSTAPSCKDDIVVCANWANRGECKKRPGFMEANCKMSCGVCGNKKTTVTGTSKSKPTTSTSSCQDNEKSCAIWAKKGECKKNPRYMKTSCKKSCGVCGDKKTTGTSSKSKSTTSSCADNHKMCDTWAKNGECKNNPGYMKVSCTKSCGVCGGKKTTKTNTSSTKSKSTSSCADNHKMCPTWAKNGECKNNPGYMKVSCKKSCGVCGDKKTTKTSSTSSTKSKSTSSCADNHKMCPTWAKNGECKNNPGYMKVSCKKSCSVCGDE